MDSDVKKLIEKAAGGDTAAFEQLITPWLKIILYKCIHLTNAQSAEDIAQEVLINIFKNIPTLRDPDKIEGWLNTIVRRTCADAVRQLKRERTQMAFDSPIEAYEELNEDRSEFLPQEYAEEKTRRELLMKVIDELPPDYREALLLFYYEEKRYKEIGEIMGKSEMQITNLLKRAKASIKKRLEKRGGTEFIFSIVPVGSIPALSKAFHADADCLITEQMCERVIAALHKAVPPLKSPNKASTANRMIFKIFVGIMVASGLITSGILTLKHQKKEIPVSESQPPPTVSAEKSEESAPSSSPSLMPPSDPAIISITDMIGEEYEAVLLAFAAGGVEEELLQVFIADIGAVLEEEAYAQDGGEYRIYLLQKQDKQLLVFGRKDKTSSKLDILYQFGNQTEGIPYMFDVILLFDAMEKD